MQISSLTLCSCNFETKSSAVTRQWNFQLKVMCKDAAKQGSAGVATRNMNGFRETFLNFVVIQVSRKVEPFSTSAAVATIRWGDKNQSFIV